MKRFKLDSMDTMCFAMFLVLLVLSFIITNAIAIHALSKYKSTINNQEAEIRLLKEENQDLNQLNTQLMEELGYYNIKGE